MCRFPWTKFVILLFSIGLGAEWAFGQSIKVMPLGDSITRGEKSTDLNGYRATLYDYFLNTGVDVDFVGSLLDGSFADKNHEGHSGWTSAQILNSIGAYMTNQEPRVVFLHIGTNDVSIGVDPNQIAANVGAIVDEIYRYNPQTEIYLAKLIPRNDSFDATNDILNDLIANLAVTRQNQGYRVFLVDQNQAFKRNSNWQNDYLFDEVHPNDAGYQVMAETWHQAFQQNSVYAQAAFVDEFNRTDLGNNWVAHPQIKISNNELHNSAVYNDWSDPNGQAYVALATAFTNAGSISFSWGASATTDGIRGVGAALMFDSPSTTGSGYMINKYISSGRLRLWEVKNGVIQSEIASVPYNVTEFGAGNVFRIDITTDAQGHHFTCYVNGELDGTLDDPAKRQGNAGTLYSGVFIYGNYGDANNIDNFALRGAPDLTSPAAITDLTVSSTTAVAALLTWTAPGDDGKDGTAYSYDLRYATSPINTDNDFIAATPVVGEPAPSPAGSPETLTVSGLQSGTTYYFAIKTFDQAGNVSSLSNSPSGATATLNLRYVTDDFNREDLGSNWVTDPGYRIVNNELANTSTGSNWDLAIYAAQKNPVEVAFQWGAGANNEGIGQGGFAVMLDSPSLSANGYLIWWRTTLDRIRLYTIVNGDPGEQVDEQRTTLPDPQAGDVVKVAISSDADGHHFALSVNGELDGVLTDPNKKRGNAETLYAGVMLTGSLQNNVDNFSVATPLGAPATITMISGDKQTGTVGTQLANPLVVRLTDEYGNPVQNTLIKFSTVQGGGSFDKEQINDEHTRIEAEAGSLALPMVARNGSDASGSKYILIPPGTPEDAGGSATYKFSLEKAGKYVIWGRVKAPSTTEDSFWFTMDGGPQMTWDVLQSAFTNVWTWDQISDRGNGTGGRPQFDPVIFSLNAGTHTLVIMHREPNTQLDKLLVTSDLSYVPTGKEEVKGYFTGEDGTTQAFLTLGPQAGMQTVQASYPNLSPVSFTATANPGPATQISKTSGDNQQGTPGQPLANPFVVTVKDKFGNPVSKVSVTFVVTEGNGTLSNSQPVLTNDNGQAATILTISSTQATNKVEARASDLTGSPVTFTATATPGDPKKLILMAGSNNQTASAGQTLPKPVGVRVVDQVGYPIANHPVTFTVTAGGGNINDGQSSVTVQTDAQGVAQVSWTLGKQAGVTNKLDASSAFGGNPLQNSPLTFTARALAPSTIAMHSGNAQPGTINSALDNPFVVLVKDSTGMVVAGQKVTFTVIQGNGKLGGGTLIEATSDSLGRASATLTLGPIPGATNLVRATSSFGGKELAGSPLEFSATAAELKQIALLDGNNQSGRVNTPLAKSIQAKVVDQRGRGVPGWTVTFTVTNGGGKLDGTPASVAKPTNSEGIAEAIWTLGTVVGINNNAVTASTTYNNQPLNGSPVQFQASATLPGAAAKLVIVSGDGQTGQVGKLLPEPFKTRVEDGFGNGIPKYDVIYEVKAGDGSINGASRDTVQTDDSGTAQATLTLGPIPGIRNNQVDAYAVNGSNPLSGSPVVFKASAEFGVGVKLTSFTAQSLPFNGIVLEWQTANEAQNAGFNVLRSASKDGEYKKLNDELIHARADGKYTFEDKEAMVGVRYYYLLEDVDFRGTKLPHGPVSALVEPPEKFVLSQNYPNPFNPETTIRYQTPKNMRVTLRIFNALGQVIRVLVDEDKPAGYYTATWDGRNELGKQVNSGIYWYRLEAGNYVETKKMIMAK